MLVCLQKTEERGESRYVAASQAVYKRHMGPVQREGSCDLAVPCRRAEKKEKDVQQERQNKVERKERLTAEITRQRGLRRLPAELASRIEAFRTDSEQLQYIKAMHSQLQFRKFVLLQEAGKQLFPFYYILYQQASC